MTREATDAYLRQPSSEAFIEQEKEADIIFAQFDELGIWDELRRLDKIEPAVRCAEIAAKAAVGFNGLVGEAGHDAVVSPKITYLVGLLFKSGQAIGENIVNQYNLGEINMRSVNLYRYPPYATERTVLTSHVLRTSAFLYRSGHPWFAELVLHGAHPQFFDGVELPSLFAALANANIGKNSAGEWHSYVHPAVSLLALAPLAQWSDSLPPEEAKDWIDRAHMVAINTTIQHALHMNASISFSDETYQLTTEELEDRWTVFAETCKNLGFPLPTPDLYEQQAHRSEVLGRWMKAHNIVHRLKQRQDTSSHGLYDHSVMVSELLGVMAEQINAISERLGRGKIVHEGYLRQLGLVHDSIKAFELEELHWLQGLRGYESEFVHTYPAEVVARGTVSLKNSHDAQLYAWLRHFEDRQTGLGTHGSSVGVAQDLLSGPYHLFSFTSSLLSYADLAVITQGKRAWYEPDITNRFLATTLKYISDPHTAVISYAKLMTVAFSLSSYLGIELPRPGAKSVEKEDLHILLPDAQYLSSDSKSRLQTIVRTLQIFGIAVPQHLYSIE